MVFENGVEFYASFWIALLGIVVVVVNAGESRVSTLYKGYIDEIDRMNGNLGLGRSVDVELLGREFIIPFRNDKIRRYASNNNLNVTEYTGQIRSNVGYPVKLLGYITLLGALLTVTFSGPLVFSISGLKYADPYFGVLLSLLFLNLMSYSLVKP